MTSALIPTLLLAQAGTPPPSAPAPAAEPWKIIDNSFLVADTPAGRVERTRALTMSPGIRGGWNLPGDTQVVIGAAVPVTESGGTRSVALFGYFSVELPFRK
jgi:hypothetical protein